MGVTWTEGMLLLVELWGQISMSTMDEHNFIYLLILDCIFVQQDSQEINQEPEKLHICEKI